MKTILIILTAYLFLSCLSQRKNHKQLQQSFAQEQERTNARSSDFYEQYSRDSTAVAWLLWTDSTFSYHPDSGLRAYRGLFRLSTLLAHEDRVVKDSSTRYMQYTDSSRSALTQKSRVWKDTVSWWMLAVPLLLYLLWKIKT